MIDRADLWLLRHGTAADKQLDRSDLEDYVRPLTRDGVRQSVNAGKLLSRLAKVDKVYTSPRVRTLQTTVLACEQIGCGWKHDKRLDHCRPHDPLEHVKEGRTTLLVVHKDVNAMIKQLTGRSVEISRGSLARVRIRNGQPALDQLLTRGDIAALVGAGGKLTLDWHFDPGQARDWHGRWGGGLSEVSHEVFAAALEQAVKGPRGNSLTYYTPQEMTAAGMRTFLAHDGKVGGALKPDPDGVNVDAVNLFNMGGPRGAGMLMLKHLQALGANRLDCFAWLEGFYTKAGWEVVERIPWDDAYAPTGWDYSAGRPEILIMRPASH